MTRVEIGGYIRITKAAARVRHNNGTACYCLPCKIRPGNMWIPFAAVPVYEPQGKTFTEFVNEYEYYNCSNYVGRYAAFYVRKEEQ
ncbi:hypothetical protein FACS189499_03850 [Clostridia bacterium]|nr:hypothetical protein FACS189499_03850 [Clostridia bacterium]